VIPAIYALVSRRDRVAMVVDAAAQANLDVLNTQTVFAKWHRFLTGARSDEVH
jgi:hypothetical protein